MEYLVLLLLQNPMTFRELEDIGAFDRDILNAYVKDLRKQGLIDRIGKRRKYVYCLTAKGLLKLYLWRLKHLLGGNVKCKKRKRSTI